MAAAGGRYAFSFRFAYAILIHAAVQSPRMKGGEYMTQFLYPIIINIVCGVIAAYIYDRYFKSRQ